MDQLPGEILLEIFILLHQTDKVQCMQVCRKWEYTVREFCLLHTLCISTRRQIKHLLKKFEKEPHRGELVERVFVFGMGDMVSAVNPLLSYFPKPREVCIPTLTLTKEVAKSKSYENWSNYIQHLNEFRNFELSTTLLSCHTFSRLETLTIRKLRRGYSCLPEIVAVLPSVPVLKELTLGYFEVEIITLEALHKAGPSIESLYFNNATILDEDHAPKVPSSMNIQPAASIKTFGISIYTIAMHLNYIIAFFEYIGIKYSNLEQLEVISTYPYLNVNDRKTIYRDAITPLCQKFGFQLKRLTCFTYDGLTYMLQMMDLANCRVRDLDIELWNSHWNNMNFDNSTEQLSHIEKLTLRNLESSDLKWLKRCTVLKELRLLFFQNTNTTKKRPLELDQIVHYLPETVTNIMIGKAEICHKKDREIKPLHLVKNLELREVDFTDGLDRFISKTFPQLRILKLKFCNMSYKTFVFPDLHLFYLHVDDIFTKRKKGIETLLIKMSTTNEKRLYQKMRFKPGIAFMGTRFTKYDKSIYPENKLLCYDQFPHDPLIIFECASVKNIIY